MRVGPYKHFWILQGVLHLQKEEQYVRRQTSICHTFHALLNGDKNHCWLTGIGSQLASETQEALTITCKPAQKNASFDFI